jgi:hypothetical protein
MNTLKILVIIWLFTGFCMEAAAQNRRMVFTGTVLDRETRSPVAGSNISISETRRVAVTGQDGNFTSKLKMPVEKISEGKWTTEIYFDNMTNRAFTSFRKGGLFTLYRIDLNTGELKRQLSPIHDFPRKIRVHNNFLYYLYDVPGEGDNKHLFRQKL